MFPHWLDPTPATRALIAQFSGIEPREPLAELRFKDEAPRKEGETHTAFGQRMGGLRALQVRREKALADALAHGETLAERRTRMRRASEAKRKKRDKDWAAEIRKL
jgi:hypothetical protein